MQQATKVGLKIAKIGQYAVFKCENCGKQVGNWFTGKIGFADCECTLWDGRGRYRTIAELNKPIN